MKCYENFPSRLQWTQFSLSSVLFKMCWKCSKSTDTYTEIISPSFVLKLTLNNINIISNTIHFLLHLEDMHTSKGEIITCWNVCTIRNTHLVTNHSLSACSIYPPVSKAESAERRIKSLVLKVKTYKMYDSSDRQSWNVHGACCPHQQARYCTASEGPVKGKVHM